MSFHCESNSWTLEPQQCVICCNVGTEDLVKVRSGLDTLVDACKLRNCTNLAKYLDSKPDCILVHAKCRKRFIDLRSVGKRVCDENLVPTKKLRSCSNTFLWKSMCFLCKRNISDRTNTADFRQASTLKLHGKFLKHCIERGDEWASDVQGRLALCNDLPAEEAIYHVICYGRFTRGEKLDPEGGVVGRPQSMIKSESFDLMCDWLEATCDNLYTLDELQQEMVVLARTSRSENNLPDVDSSELAYDVKHLKRKLVERYGDHIFFAEICGRPNVVCFRNMCSFIITDKWYSDRKYDSHDESLRIVKAAAQLITAEIRDLACDMSHYKPVDGEDGDDSVLIPRLLQSLLTVIVPSPVKRNFIGQALVQAAKPRTFLSPLLLNLGLELDHLYGSKFLTTQLSRLGVCSSYDEITMYKQSVVVAQDPNCVEPVTSSDESAVILTQWIADNVDHNIRTLDGKNTFHGMGIISVSMCSSGKIVRPSHIIPRIEKRRQVAELIANRGIPILSYDGNRKSGLSPVMLQSLRKLQNPIVMPPIMNLNIMWHLTSLLRKSDTVHPNWSGYMQSIVTGEHSSKGEVRMLPLIDLTPSDDSCVYSTLLFVKDQASKLNVVDPCVTFDQPLWLKAVEICSSNQLDIVCRLGGFHTIMSFLGSIGNVMDGSGLAELFEVIYGHDTVGHIMSGKAVSRATRGHFLIQGALMAKLLKLIMPGNDEVSQSGVMTNDELCDIKCLIETVSNDKVNWENSEMFQRNSLRRVEELLECVMNRLSCESRTAKLWIQYIHYIDVMKLFIVAERTGSWHLHLQAMHDMLNLFAATGHNNYTKCGRLYLQLMQDLPNTHPWLYDMFTTHGFHSVRRSDRYWAGLSTDLIIEQVMMKTIKGSGGLTRGRGMTESVRTVWLNTLPECAGAHLTMSSLTGLYNTMQQHVDIGISRSRRDLCDVEKLEEWLDVNDPFEVRDGRLRSLSTGVTASDEDKVTCDIAEKVGADINSNMDNVSFYNISCKRNDQVKTLSYLYKQHSVGEKDAVTDTNNLFHRLVLSVERSADIPSHFAYELTASPSSLFKGDTMRKANKPVLAKLLVKDLPVSIEPRDVKYVIDGGALLHRVRWLKNAKYGDIFGQYVTYVIRHYGSDAVVVFDGYRQTPSTKDHEHCRRANKVNALSPDIDIEANKPVLFEQHAFLSNDHNKTQFINLLMIHLDNSGITSSQSDGDADIDIVSTALNLASSQNQPIGVVADDTDILVLLVHHFKPATGTIYFISEAKRATKEDKKFINIHDIQEKIGNRACRQLLTIHAIGGCDTTSAIFNHGKGKIFQKITKQRWTEICTDTLQSKNATCEAVTQSGLKLMTLIYDGKKNDTLNRMRYNAYCQMSANSSSRPEPQKLPPTEDAAIFHIFRAHHQAVVWETLSASVSDPMKWGWKLKDGKLVPIMSDKSIAPADILKVIRCNCKSGCNSVTCTCRKNGLPCVSACGSCHGNSCTNAEATHAKTVEQNSEQINFDNSDTQCLQQEDFIDCWDHDVVDEEVVDPMEFPYF